MIKVTALMENVVLTGVDSKGVRVDHVFKGKNSKKSFISVDKTQLAQAKKLGYIKYEGKNEPLPSEKNKAKIYETQMEEDARSDELGELQLALTRKMSLCRAEILKVGTELEETPQDTEEQKAKREELGGELEALKADLAAMGEERQGLHDEFTKLAEKIADR